MTGSVSLMPSSVAAVQNSAPAVRSSVPHVQNPVRDKDFLIRVIFIIVDNVEDIYRILIKNAPFERARSALSICFFNL